MFKASNEIRIGIDCRLINKVQNTGISRYTEFLIDYYITRYDQDSIFLITNDQVFKYLNCKIIYSSLKPFSILDFMLFKNLVRKLNLNLYHSPFYSGFFNKVKDVITIITVHDLMYRVVTNFFDKNSIINKIKVLYFDFIVKRSLLNADAIISVSKTTQRDVLKTFELQSKYIPENSEINQGADYSVLEKNNLETKKFYFYCGNARPHKNLDFIIHFFNSNPILPPLVIAGKGHSNSMNVITTGVVTDEELKALYKSSIAFIFPSKYEGFGLPILEALRSNTFVIASKIPAFLEFKSQNIFFFELNNKTEFMNAINKTSGQAFIDEKEALIHYDKRNIYQLHDELLKTLMSG